MSCWHFPDKRITQLQTASVISDDIDNKTTKIIKLVTTVGTKNPLQ